MSGRIKHEVSNARTRLDATLQSLVDKKEDSSNLYDSSQESDDDSDILPITVEVVRSSGTPVSSPVKKVQVPRAKKRKRRFHSDFREEDANFLSRKKPETTYVMKLFDRSVDLAEFTESTPLYPIARKWINNKRIEEAEASEERPEFQEDSSGYIYKLPEPVKLKTEYGIEVRDPRIPPVIPCTEKPLDIHAVKERKMTICLHQVTFIDKISEGEDMEQPQATFFIQNDVTLPDPDLGPPPEELLLRHMDRWKRTRQSWIEAARINELKYSQSLNIIKDIFEKNLQEQSFEA